MKVLEFLLKLDQTIDEIVPMWTLIKLVIAFGILSLLFKQ